jgi:anti-sigma factor RsiW
MLFMPEHLEDGDLQRFVSGQLDAQALLAADDHLASCRECRSRLSPLASRAPALARQLSGPMAPAHLQYEQLEAYVDGTLNALDREICDTHLEDCADCAEDLRDLQSAAAPRAGIAPSRANLVWQRAARIAASVIVIGSVATVAWRMRPSPVPAAVPVTPTVEAPKAAAPLAASPLIVALTDDRTVVGLATSGDAILPAAWPAEYRDGIQAALASGLLTGPAAPAFNAAGRLMGDSAPPRSFAVLSPMSTVVEDDRPTFTWQAVPGARYRVSVFDENFDLVTRSPELAARSWRPSAALPRGTRYLWQVTAEADGVTWRAPAPPAPEAAFVVLDAKTAASLTAARRDHPDAHLLLGVMLYRAGLFKEAAAELDALVRANPASPLAKQLRNQAAGTR